MSAIFERAATLWVRYDTYEIRTADNGKQYLTPAADAMPEIIDPLEDAKQMVLDAINIGLMIMGHHPKVLLEQALLRFAARYGLLGLMTALPTTARFMDYLYVYLIHQPMVLPVRVLPVPIYHMVGGGDAGFHPGLIRLLLLAAGVPKIPLVHDVQKRGKFSGGLIVAVHVVGDRYKSDFVLPEEHLGVISGL